MDQPSTAAAASAPDQAEALKASERRLELATEAAGIGIWDWDLASGEMIYSPRARMICGFSLDEPLSYEMVRDATHPDDYPITSALARRALDPDLREKPIYEYRLVRPDGSRRWVLAHGEAVFEPGPDGADRAVRYVGTIQDITERKQAAEALRESEESLRLAQEAGGIGTWSLDLTTPGRDRWSPHLYKLRGMPPDWKPSFAGWIDRVHEEDRARVRESFAAALAPGGSDDFAVAYRFIGPDGEERWQESRGSVRRGAGGEAVAAQGIAVDITERKRTEQALAETVERLRLATEGTGLGTYDLDLVNDVGIWSAPTFEMLGLPVPPDCRANSAAWRNLLHPDDVARVAQEHRRASAAGGSWRIQYRILRADTGEERWMSVYGQFILEDGVPLRSVGIVVDITEQKRAEAEAAAARYRLDRVNQATPSLVHIYDRDRRKSVWINGRVQELVGFTPEEVLARPSGSLAELVHPEDLPKIFERYDALEPLPDGEVVETEYRILRRDGEWRWLLDRTVAFVRDPGGRVVQTLTAAIDITERKQSEDRQALLMHELNHRVKNTLAIVQSLAAQTFRGDGIDPRRRRDFEERLAALSTVHNLLTRENWEAADLGDVLAQAIAPYDGEPSRFVRDGPPVMLAPKTAVALSLALHELCTNAAKYGALSRDGGRVVVRWRVDRIDGAERLRLEWREKGGPPVEPPKTRGFGSRMIERGLAAELGGSVALDFAPAGLACRVDAQL